MSYKRSRSAFEADLNTPYTFYGTPLPEDPGVRDDGSYQPLWKQDVRDERGRRRLHGAFTGGWSAGYFNTVGSKEGWTPATFVSSRNDRRKDDAKSFTQRAEDYMDEEDLADAAEAKELHTSQAFAGLGASSKEQRIDDLAGLLRPDGDTMGFKLLRRMGWKDGQGIGQRVQRAARLVDHQSSSSADSKTYLFAPDNVTFMRLHNKIDRHGLGFRASGRLKALSAEQQSEDETNGSTLRVVKSLLPSKARKKDAVRESGIGVGILNDTGSDDEDPYEVGPRISYNRFVGATKKKKPKTLSAVSNPKLVAPKFVPKGARNGSGLRRCHDGLLPLDGFVLAGGIEDISLSLSKYAPPPIPEGWQSSKRPRDSSQTPVNYKSAADTAKESTLDPRSRAAILGEKALPGKSVFDYINSSSREKLVAASGKADLPPARGEIPAGYELTEEERHDALLEQIPKLDRETALAAIARGSKGPYADNEQKRKRYRDYLDLMVDKERPLPTRSIGMSDNEFIQEMTEYYNCARIFKPMTGFMASRFTTAKSSSNSNITPDAKGELITMPEPRIADPAEEAAKVGMYGTLTRTSQDFYPTRLLCKRFNVRPPTLTTPQDEENERAEAHQTQAAQLLLENGVGRGQAFVGTTPPTGENLPNQPSHDPVPAMQKEVNPEINKAVEGTAPTDVLRSIFGDSDSEEE